ncbi:hypothetical protein ABBQ38_007188 [Trebouxia sp. C0009 RCD-2024]
MSPSFSSVVAILAAAVSLFWIKDLRLPYPCFKVVQTIPPDQRPTPSDLRGSYSANSHLQKARKLFEQQVDSAETVSIGKDGTLYLPDSLGRIWTSQNAGEGKLRELAYAGGKPLGGFVYPNGDAVFADAVKGLILVNATSGLTTILANRVSPSSSKHPGTEVIYADDLDVASDGTVYFSTMTDIPLLRSASGRYEALPPCELNIMQGGAEGRLLSYSPATGQTLVLADNIWLANGVAVSHDESFVVVVSTASMRIYKYWRKGSKAGSLEVLLDHLPGFPDGVSKASDGNFWVAINSAPPPKALGLLMASRLLRWINAWVPLAVVKNYGLVLKVCKPETCCIVHLISRHIAPA